MVRRFSKKKIDEGQLSLFDNLKTKEKENDRHNENTIQNTIGTQHRENIPRAPQTFETGWASTTGDETDIRKDGSRSRTYRHTEQSISRDDQQISSPNQQRDTETGENSNRLHERTEKLLNKPFKKK